jgi:hypothetical protein
LESTWRAANFVAKPTIIPDIATPIWAMVDAETFIELAVLEAADAPFSIAFAARSAEDAILSDVLAADSIAVDAATPMRPIDFSAGEVSASTLTTILFLLFAITLSHYRFFQLFPMA